MKKILILYITLLGFCNLKTQHWWRPASKQMALFYWLHNEEVNEEMSNIKYAPLVFGYHYKADKALMKKKNNEIHTSPLSHLMFQSSIFSPSEALTPQSASNRLAPLLNQPIAPRIKIEEHGLCIGMEANLKINNQWDILGRIYIPFSTISCKKNNPALEGKSIFGGPTVDDFYVLKNEPVPGSNGTVEDFAIRLDFATGLPASINAPGNQVAWINYNSSVTNTFTINGIDVTDNQPNSLDKNPITIITNNNSKKPPSPYGTMFTDAASLESLASDGSTTSVRTKLSASVDYSQLADNQSAQNQLWLVPSITNDSASTSKLVPMAELIKNNFKNFIANIYDSPEGIFQDHNVSFYDYKKRGIGDIKVDMCARYHINTKSFCDIGLSIELPSCRTTQKNNAHIFAISPGNNGHTSFSLAFDGIHTITRFFNISWATMFGRCLSTQEYIPAAFKGATVTNFNPFTPAYTSWFHITNRIDFRCEIPSYYSSATAFNIVCGYELYFKSKTNIPFLYAKEYDGTGKLQSLDQQLAAQNSQQHAHTVSTILMYKQNTYFTIFGSLDYVFAGMNTPRTVGWNIGLEKRF